MLGEPREASPRAREGALFVFALAVRLFFLALFTRRGMALTLGRDPYYSVAMSWLGFGPKLDMDATHPPLYSGFIAAVLGVLRTCDPTAILVLQAILSAASCVLLLRLARRLGDLRVGALAAFWMALDPALIFYAPQLQSETLFVVLELGFFLTLYWSLEPGLDSSSRALAAGLLGAAASLCRSVFAAYPIFLVPAVWTMLGVRRSMKWTAAFCLGWLIPIGAWTARNFERYGEIIPISSQMGWTFYEGFTLDRREIERRPSEMADELRRQGISGHVEGARYFKHKTLRFIREYPMAAARIIAGKALLYWRPWPYDPYTPAQRVLVGAYYALLFGLALAGAWELRREIRLWLPIAGLFAYLTASHAVFFTSLRYRVPLEPFLCLLAAKGALRAWDVARKNGGPQTPC